MWSSEASSADNGISSKIVYDANMSAQSKLVDSVSNNNRAASKRGGLSGESKATAVAATVTSDGGLVRVSSVWTDKSFDAVWAACSDGAVRLWSGPDGRPIRTVKGHEGHITVMEGVDAAGVSATTTSIVATGGVDK